MDGCKEVFRGPGPAGGHALVTPVLLREVRSPCGRRGRAGQPGCGEASRHRIQQWLEFLSLAKPPGARPRHSRQGETRRRAVGSVTRRLRAGGMLAPLGPLRPRLELPMKLLSGVATFPHSSPEGRLLTAAQCPGGCKPPPPLCCLPLCQLYPQIYTFKKIS